MPDNARNPCNCWRSMTTYIAIAYPANNARPLRPITTTRKSFYVCGCVMRCSQGINVRSRKEWMTRRLSVDVPAHSKGGTCGFVQYKHIAEKRAIPCRFLYLSFT